jgi:hypothetical protein
LRLSQMAIGVKVSVYANRINRPTTPFLNKVFRRIETMLLRNLHLQVPL